ncbi:hypothetical protein NEA10_13355 [Phormidium yuhuli AB48]|uniref:Uncharacterized protein n=1 Tax=Phormidium yuhuli AB48 TaxID=2940671 RepID=A0ABY5ALP6_9CYAN|nr:hypothetical protein [Phormidium yuhuli]USR89843.1 hypothetical protein NEA10_13355 [Phormidium yuhuli AB48]
MDGSMSELERLESLKAGVLSAVIVVLVDSVAAISVSSRAEDLTLRLGIVALSGFLFGVTYRYAVRGDSNPHLKSGVIGAFGLVRGLAQLEGLDIPEQVTAIALLSLFESLGLFGIAGLGLDVALKRQWVKPML